MQGGTRSTVYGSFWGNHVLAWDQVRFETKVAIRAAELEKLGKFYLLVGRTDRHDRHTDFMILRM